MSIYRKNTQVEKAKNFLRGDLLPLSIALVVPFIAAAIGTRATGASVATWYKTLRKPTWNPPPWIFGPVWTVLYTMMGIASWLVWRSGHESNQGTLAEPGKQQAVNRILTLYGVHLLFNLLWPIIFFGRRNIKWALVEIVALWGLIASTLTGFYRIKPAAGWLLVPYLLWSTFATLLNATIWQMNRRNFLARFLENPFWSRG